MGSWGQGSDTTMVGSLWRPDVRDLSETCRVRVGRVGIFVSSQVGSRNGSHQSSITGTGGSSSGFELVPSPLVRVIPTCWVNSVPLCIVLDAETSPVLDDPQGRRTPPPPLPHTVKPPLFFVCQNTDFRSANVIAFSTDLPQTNQNFVLSLLKGGH